VGGEKPVCQVLTAFSLQVKSPQVFIRSEPVELCQTFFVRNGIDRNLVVSYLHIREGKRKLNKDQSSCLEDGECLRTHLASSPLPSRCCLLCHVFEAQNVSENSYMSLQNTRERKTTIFQCFLTQR